MRQILRNFMVVSALGLAAPLPAQEAPTSAPPDPVALWEADRTAPLPAEALPLGAFTWRARPIVVFADSPFDPRFVEQIELLATRAEDLALRDVVVLTDTDPAAASALRQKLRPRGFMVVLIAKDGTISARRPTPRDGRELSRQIDKMPLRQQEMRDRHGQPGPFGPR